MWQRITERIDDWIALGCCALIFSIVKTLAIPSTRTFRNFLVTVMVSVPCGMLCGAVAKEAGYGDSACFAAVAIMVIFADRLIAWLLDGKRISDMDTALANLIERFTKQK